MSSRWTVHTVVFDLDDTLYEEKDYVLSGFAAVDAWLRSKGILGFEAEARRKFASGSRGRVFDEVLKSLQINATSQVVAEMIDVYRNHHPALKLLPDAEQALQWTVDAGLRTALITDGFAGVQRRKIEALNLERRISCCIVTDELGGQKFWKPHPAAFSHVMDYCPGQSDGYVYVADNPRKDFIAPRRLGWKSIRVRRSGGEHEKYQPAEHEIADAEIRELTQLMEVLTPQRP